MTTTSLFEAPEPVAPFKTQLLKWIGNKQRFAHEIASYFPGDVATYYEPFLGSGAVLSTYAPRRGVAADALAPLAEIWTCLEQNPEELKSWYAERRNRVAADFSNKSAVYEQVKSAFNASPNGADLLYLCRSCYGGVVRFRQADRHLSTPCGAHTPISSDSFDKRVDLWAERVRGTTFAHADYRDTMAQARRGDLVYCDPPYTDSQTILYGAHRFSLEELFEAIDRCRSRGVRVALSIDGTKKSGLKTVLNEAPDGLFKSEVMVNCGRSMLRRFQMEGMSLESEVVADRLLLTY
ncbi:MAG: Dam family site-specific DNA-(adenine-N6)-methyltransferase [Gordonia sp. (in: high G+C Gram-positive bacteria)]|uniref:Dam family site-specific DNA-(adenine-N6)-methyltransferase n=1 Tax=Gordonia sp. (in: high G+C Gram-positive bacteria) TaxID=84139 RepID=UPI0039E23CD4